MFRSIRALGLVVGVSLALVTQTFAAGFVITDAVFSTDANGLRTSIELQGRTRDGANVSARAADSSSVFSFIPQPPGGRVITDGLFSPSGGSFSLDDRRFQIDVAHPNFANFSVIGIANLPSVFQSGEFFVTGPAALDATLGTCNPFCDTLTAKATGLGTWRLFGGGDTTFYTVKDFRLEISNPAPPVVADAPYADGFNAGDPKFNSWIGPLFDEEGRGFAVHYVPGQGYPGLNLNGGSNGELSTVPEPTSFILLASGLVGFRLLARRKTF
ncbi:MAG: PEP-CTERM sorting domain-containing protein [Nitrospiraceae bacterium]